MSTAVYFSPSGEEVPAQIRDSTAHLSWVSLSSVSAAEHFVSRRRVDLLLLDLRDDQDSAGPRLLEQLFPDGAMPGVISRRRTIAWVPGDAQGARLAFRLGQFDIAEVIPAPATHAQVVGCIGECLGKVQYKRVAICLAGGGIEGLLYELGVLRALDDFLVQRKVIDADLFCGISAGAVIGAFLANGIGPAELARAMDGRSARIEPVRRTDLFDPNFSEMSRRVGSAVRHFVTKGDTSGFSRALPSGIFAGDRLGAWLERQLERPGMHNKFPDLRRTLLIGATDQDTSEAVVFGRETHPHIPVHQAVRASAALAPFYRPVCIDGRYYVDGSFSRTTNMRLAMDQGATLVILIDPLVPVQATRAGYVNERGGFYGTVQGLKALINGRFDKAVRAIREMYPDVAFYLFSPEQEERRIMAGSPMKFFFRKEVERVAYESTARKIRRWLPEMSQDFERHGMTLIDPDVGGPRRPITMAPVHPESFGVGV